MRRRIATICEAIKALYAEIGITEYFLCDVEGRYLPTPLMGFRLAGKNYDAIPPNADGSVPSAGLGLELSLREERLGFYNPVLKRWLETPAEAAVAQARRAESVAEREAEARKKAETELARLREEIERMKASSESPEREFLKTRRYAAKMENLYQLTE